jgi:hypothetical protein
MSLLPDVRAVYEYYRGSMRNYKKTQKNTWVIPVVGYMLLGIPVLLISTFLVYWCYNHFFPLFGLPHIGLTGAIALTFWIVVVGGIVALKEK